MVVLAAAALVTVSAAAASGTVRFNLYNSANCTGDAYVITFPVGVCLPLTEYGIPASVKLGCAAGGDAIDATWYTDPKCVQEPSTTDAAANFCSGNGIVYLALNCSRGTAAVQPPPISRATQDILVRALRPGAEHLPERS